MLFNQGSTTRDGMYSHKYSYLTEANSLIDPMSHLRGSSGTGTGSDEHTTGYMEAYEGGSMTMRRFAGTSRYGTATFSTGATTRLGQSSTQRFARRYDEQTHLGREPPAFSEEQELLLDRNIHLEEKSKKTLLRFNVVKKGIRFLIFGVVILVALLFMNFLSKLMDVRENYQVPEGLTALEIHTSSCYLYLETKTDASRTIDISLQANELLFTPSILFELRRVSRKFSLSAGLAKLEIVHDYKDYTCTLHIKVPAAVSMDSLAVNCQGICTLIARSEATVKIFSLRGYTVHSNFKKLTSESVTIDIKNGFLEINQLSTLLPSTVSNVNGTTVIQTSEDTTVTLVSASDVYCFSSPFFGANSIVCAEEQITDESTKNLYEISKYNKCSGALQLCRLSAACSPSKALSLSTLTGSIYLNLLQPLDSAVQSEAVQTVSGPTFAGPINIKASELKLLESILSKANSPLTLPLILKVDIGNFKAESSASTKWILTEYPLTSVYDPWTIAGVTFGILAQNFQEINLALSPGFCPWRPVLNKMQ